MGQHVMCECECKEENGYLVIHILFCGFLASDRDTGNPLPPPHGPLFPISNEGSFIGTIPRTG